MLLFLHGALFDHTQFDSVRARLDRVATLAIDFNGHGKTPRARALRIENLVEDVERDMDRLGLGQVSIFGYSMGGYVALMLALRLPQRVNRVMTLGTKIDWSPAYAARETSRLDAVTIRSKVPHFARQLEQLHTGAGWQQLLADTAEMMQALGDAPPLDDEQFAKFSCPVRLAVGDRDTSVTVEETRAAQLRIPGAQLEVFPGTPHPFDRVDVDRLTHSILGFFG